MLPVVPQGDARPSVTVSESTSEPNVINVRIELPQTARAVPDSLVVVASVAKEWGISPKSLVAAAKDARIARKLGRQLVARRSDLVALVDDLELASGARSSEAADVAGDYAALARAARGSR